MGTLVATTNKLSISIGDTCCSIRCQDEDFLNLLRERYHWFESSGPAAYDILLQLVPLSELPFDGLGNPPQPVVKRINTEYNYIIKRADNPFVAVVNTLSKKVLVKMWNSQYCFDSFLRILYTLILAEQGGLLLHASSVSDGRQGYVFFGPSGSGKTTIANLSPGHTILTDELALIRPRDGRYQIYGTPFWGEFTPGRSNTLAELTGLYLLKKEQRNSLVPLDAVSAVTELYRSVLFFSKEIPLLKRVLETCCALVDTVPVYELHFRPDASFWEVVNERS